MYVRGSEVEATDRGKVCCMVKRPVFNRTYEHFSSHMHAPSSGEEVYPGIVEGENSFTLHIPYLLFIIYIVRGGAGSCSVI